MSVVLKRLDLYMRHIISQRLIWQILDRVWFTFASECEGHITLCPRGCDHEIVKALEPHLKAIPWKEIRN